MINLIKVYKYQSLCSKFNQVFIYSVISYQVLQNIIRQWSSILFFRLDLLCFKRATLKGASWYFQSDPTHNTKIFLTPWCTETFLLCLVFPDAFLLNNQEEKSVDQKTNHSDTCLCINIFYTVWTNAKFLPMHLYICRNF